MADKFLVRVYRSEDSKRRAVAIAAGLNAFSIELATTTHRIDAWRSWDDAVATAANVTHRDAEAYVDMFVGDSAVELSLRINKTFKNSRLMSQFNKAMGQILTSDFVYSDPTEREFVVPAPLEIATPESELDELEQLLSDLPSETNDNWGMF